MTAERGPISVHISPDRFETQEPDYPGTTVQLVSSSNVPGADMYGGIVTLEPGVTIDLHFHTQFELQYILEGEGLALDSIEGRIPLKPGDFVLSPGGPDGAHGFVNTGEGPLKILFLYPTKGGHLPDRFEVADQ